MDDSNAQGNGRLRLSRFASLAKAGSRIGLDALMGQQQRAGRVAQSLGQLRGLGAKFGQMLAYVDGMLPEELTEAYGLSLKELLSQAPTSAFEDIRRLAEAELGMTLETAYASFDPVPMASASLGQVHRATLHDGRQVVVKVQHPGVAQGVESDLANGELLRRTFNIGPLKRFDTGAMLAELAGKLREELDYGLEARRQVFFEKLHHDDPQIIVPGIIHPLCRPRLLTSLFVEGLSFDQAQEAPESERKAWAETLWRFVFRGTLVGGQFNADPHPGNFAFLPGGKVACFDYGCVQALAPARREVAISVHSAALAGDMDAFGEGVIKLLEAPEGAYRDWAEGYVRTCFRPVLAPSFHITKPYARELFDELKKVVMSGKASGIAEDVALPEGMLLMNRLQLGFYSLLARLDVAAEYARQEARVVEEARALTAFPPMPTTLAP